MALAGKRTPVVYAIQEQKIWNQVSGEFVLKYDLTPARRFGEIKFLLGPSAAPFYSEGVIKELRDKLADYREQDYLLLIGNPCLIGFAVAIAAQRTSGRVRLLQWHGKQREYIPVEADLYS